LRSNKNKLSRAIYTLVKLIVPLGIVLTTNDRLCKINQKTQKENMTLTLKLMVLFTILSTIYFGISFKLFHALWYHKLLTIMATATFFYLIREMYFEIEEYRVKSAYPRTFRKISHYYFHYNKNIDVALKEAESKVPPINKLLITKLVQATSKPNYDMSLDHVKENVFSIWVKMLCNIVSIAKTYSGQVIGEAIETITNLIEYYNIQQSFLNVELLGFELATFFSPMLIIPAGKLFNSYILNEIGGIDVYQSVEAQNITALLLLLSNVGALFIHWLRKNQN
jgi:hypothetical protein